MMVLALPDEFCDPKLFPRRRPDPARSARR